MSLGEPLPLPPVVPSSSQTRPAPSGTPTDQKAQLAAAEAKVLAPSHPGRSSTASSQKISRAWATPFIMTATFLGGCLRGVKNALSSITRGMREVRSHWGERSVSYFFGSRRGKGQADQLGSELAVRDLPDTSRLSLTEIKVLDAAESRIRKFNTYVSTPPIKPEALTALLEMQDLFSNEELIGRVNPGLLAKLDESIRLLLRSSLFAEQKWALQTLSTTVLKFIEKNREAILNQRRQKAALPARYAAQSQVAARAVTDMQTNPKWFSELNTLMEIGAELGGELDITNTRGPCSQCLESIFDGTVFTTKLHHPRPISPKELKGPTPKGLEDLFSRTQRWAKSCSSSEIINTFGRRAPSQFTINGQPVDQELFKELGEDTDPGIFTMKAYLIFEQLVQEYKRLNPHATEQEATDIVNEAMRRQAIEFSTAVTFLCIGRMAGSGSAIVDTNSSFSFSISERAITVEKKGTLEKREPEVPTKSISYSAQITVTPEDVGKTEWTETFTTGTGKPTARVQQDTLAAVQQGSTAKTAKEIQGDIAEFCGFARFCPDKHKPEVLLEKLNQLNAKLGNLDVCVQVGNFPKFLEALKSLATNKALGQQTVRQFQAAAKALEEKRGKINAAKEQQREELLATVRDKRIAALACIATDPPDPAWGRAIHDLTSAKKKAKSLGFDIPPQLLEASPFSEFARSLFRDQGRRITSTLVRPTNMPPLGTKGSTDEGFLQWAQRPGAQAIVNSFGRTNVTMNAQPFVRNKDNQAQSAYAVFKKFVQEYKEKNPSAQYEDVEALVFDAMLRSSIDVSTLSVLSPLAELTRDPMTRQNLMLGEADDVQKFVYEFTIHEGAITVCKKGEMTLRASDDEGEPQKKKYTTTFTMTPKDVGAQTWTETLDTTTQPV